MLRRGTPCLSRIPDIGYQTPAKVKWATYTFWYILDPFLRRHHWYYRRKVQLDCFLEKNNFVTNTLFGVILGLTLYVGVGQWLLLPPAVGAEDHTMQENAREVLRLMDCDTTKELPAYQLMRVKREVIGRLHAVSDAAEVRRQKEEVEKMQKMLERL